MQTVFIFPVRPVWVSGHDSAVLLHAPVVTWGLPSDPALIRERGLVGPFKMPLVIKVGGSYPYLGESKVLSESSQKLLDSLVLFQVPHASQVGFLNVTAVDFSFRPRQHVSPHENELVYGISVVEL